jgi:hypothetical protein
MDIEINEKSFLEWQEEKHKQLKQNWIDKLYNKVNKSIDQYFYEINYNFKEWKCWMVKSNNDIKKLYNKKEILGLSLRGGFPYYHAYFHRDSFKIKTSWDIYSKMAKNPTITEYIKFVETWKNGGKNKGITKPNANSFDFEDMFINV